MILMIHVCNILIIILEKHSQRPVYQQRGYMKFAVLSFLYKMATEQKQVQKIWSLAALYKNWCALHGRYRCVQI